jgi:CRISPR-associated protein Csb3
MAEAVIPVDLLNPGQIFACLGFLEAAETLVGECEGAYEWNDGTDASFRLRAAGDDNPFGIVLDFLARATVSSIAPAASAQNTAQWGLRTIAVPANSPFPFPDPPSPATLPAMLLGSDGKCLIVDHWGDATSRDNVKFWAGAGGYPGSALLRDALDLARDRTTDAIADPFAISAPQSSSFRFDWRRDYIPMDAGFSPNDHVDLTMLGFPLVEILAAIGLSNARPERIDKLTYRYAVIKGARAGHVVSPVFLRAALGAAPLPFPQRVFRMHLGWPGQENQARCVTEVIEEKRS